MSERIFEVGDEVEALCNKCKDLTLHVIEVIKEEKIAKVMCKSCMSSHRYRIVENLPELKAKKVVKKKVKTGESSKTKEQRKWTRLMSKANAETLVDYRMDGQFTENDMIKHDKFGIGIVLEVLDQNKISVSFEDGIKTMVHKRPQ